MRSWVRRSSRRIKSSGHSARDAVISEHHVVGDGESLGTEGRRACGLDPGYGWRAVDGDCRRQRCECATGAGGSSSRRVSPRLDR